MKRQVPDKLVHDHPRQEAHIRTAALKDRSRRRCRHHLARVPALECLAHVAQHHPRARLLGQTVGDLLADLHPLTFRDRLGLGVGNMDRLHRHRVVEPQAFLVDAARAVLPPPLLHDLFDLCFLLDRSSLTEEVAHLRWVRHQTPFRGRAEDLLPEPGECLPERRDLLAELGNLLFQGCNRVSGSCHRGPHVLVEATGYLYLQVWSMSRRTVWNHKLPGPPDRPDPAPAPARHPDLQTIHKSMELRPRQHPLARTPTAQRGKQSLLQAFGPDTEPARLEAQHLAHRPAAVDEDIPAARQGVAPKVLPHQSLQAIEGLSAQSVGSRASHTPPRIRASAAAAPYRRQTPARHPRQPPPETQPRQRTSPASTASTAANCR